MHVQLGEVRARPGALELQLQVCSMLAQCQTARPWLAALRSCSDFACASQCEHTLC